MICDGIQLLKLKRRQALIIAQIQFSNPLCNPTGDCAVRKAVRHWMVQTDTRKNNLSSPIIFTTVLHNCMLTQAFTLFLLATYNLHAAALSRYVTVGYKKRRENAQ